MYSWVLKPCRRLVFLAGAAGSGAFLGTVCSSTGLRACSIGFLTSTGFLTGAAATGLRACSTACFEVRSTVAVFLVAAFGAALLFLLAIMRALAPLRFGFVEPAAFALGLVVVLLARLGAVLRTAAREDFTVFRRVPADPFLVLLLR